MLRLNWRKIKMSSHGSIIFELLNGGVRQVENCWTELSSMIAALS